MNKILNEENLNKVHQGVALIEKLAKENIFDFILFVQDRITDFSSEAESDLYPLSRVVENNDTFKEKNKDTNSMKRSIEGGFYNPLKKYVGVSFYGTFCSYSEEELFDEIKNHSYTILAYLILFKIKRIPDKEFQNIVDSLVKTCNSSDELEELFDKITDLDWE